MKMAKRARTGLLGCRKHKEARKENLRPPPWDILLKDRISQLPSEILVDILSQLKTNEAGRTSILSRRWRHMWTSIVNLEFDASEVFDNWVQKRKSLKEERPIYIRCVDQAIRNHQGQTIDRFVVVFSLDESSGSYLDRWVSFAVRKRVQSLKLDLRSHWRSAQRNCYNFPHSLEVSRCSSLTSLHLAEINITGEMLQLFLCNCLNLERVFVRGSKTLLSLNVDGPSLKLKWLDLHLCHNIQCLNVSAPNLVSFKYTGPVIPMPLKDVPKLREISVMGYYSFYLLPRLSELSSYLSQLEKLSLEIRDIEALMRDALMKDARYPVLSKLKHLTLTIGAFGLKNLFDYASLINACPSLYKFSFQVWISCICDGRKSAKVEARPHNIKEVEFIGFRGQAVEVELAMYLIENAVMLQKISFDAITCPLVGQKLKEKPDEDQISARECARELGKRLPPGVELIIV